MAQANSTTPKGFGGVHADAVGPLSFEITQPGTEYPTTWHLRVRLGSGLSMHAAFGTEDREAIANLLYAAAREVLAVWPEPEAAVPEAVPA